MAKRRKFTAKFKAEVVLEAFRGESSQLVGFRQTCVSNDPLHGGSAALAESSQDA